MSLANNTPSLSLNFISIINSFTSFTNLPCGLPLPLLPSTQAGNHLLTFYLLPFFLHVHTILAHSSPSISYQWASLSVTSPFSSCHIYFLKASSHKLVIFSSLVHLISIFSELNILGHITTRSCKALLINFSKYLPFFRNLSSDPFISSFHPFFEVVELK